MNTVPPPHVAADWTIPQAWDRYTAEAHETWDMLFARQIEVLQGRASEAFMRGVDVLRMDRPGIPDFAELSAKLTQLTGWRVVAVPGLVPDDVFFDHLANRTFVAGNFIRRRDQLDYLQEPDVFHDVFGHVPLLADPVFADYLVAYGKGGQRANGLGVLKLLARLYWYTVEFGLVEEAGALRIYGAGIVSSKGESIFSLESASPNRVAFDLSRVMRTDYRIDDYQQTYFVIPSFSELLRITVETDFAPLYARLRESAVLGPAMLDPADRVLTRGDQSWATGRSRPA